jgi:hypothetical protein
MKDEGEPPRAVRARSFVLCLSSLILCLAAPASALILLTGDYIQLPIDTPRCAAG